MTKQQRLAILKVQRKGDDKQTRKQKIKKITITLDKVTKIRYNKGTKKGKQNMKNTNITRTINIATATITYVNLKAMAIETVDVSIVTTQKVSEKDFVKWFNDGTTYKQIKVDNIRYESKLYEMSLEDFVKYGNEVGNGRVTL